MQFPKHFYQRKIPERLKKPNLNVKFSKARRSGIFERSIESSPGPGAYQASSASLFGSKSYSSKTLSKIQKVKSLSQRFRDQTEDTPGPGVYGTPLIHKKTAPKFSIFTKTHSQTSFYKGRKDLRPSPDQYNTTSNFWNPKSNSISIPKDAKLKSIDTASPGPGRYETGIKKFSSQQSFGKRSFSTQRKTDPFNPKNDLSPGPSKYYQESSFLLNAKHSKGFSHGQKYKDGRLDKVPGPGSYDQNSLLNLKSKTLSCKFPQSTRNFLGVQSDEFAKNRGPGKYEDAIKSYTKVKFRSMQVNKFSKSPLKSLQSPKLRSPDKYYEYKIEQQSSRQRVKSFSMESQTERKFDLKSAVNSPSPNKYNPEDNITRKRLPVSKFSVTNRHDPVSIKLKVSPGSYHAAQSQKKLNTSNSGARFSKGKRQSLFQNSNEIDRKEHRGLVNTMTVVSDPFKK